MKRMIIVITVTSLTSVLLAQGTNGITKTAKVEGVVTTAVVSTSTFTADVIADNKNKRIVKEDGFLRFRDKSGKIKKEFGLKERRENVTVFDNNEKTKKRTEIKREWKLSAVSPNGENAVVITNVDNPLDKNIRQIETYDKDGNVIWKKELASGRTVWMDSEVQKDVQISDNGIAAIESTDIDGEDVKLEVFSKSGELIVSFPDETCLIKYGYCRPSKFILTSDGMYLGAGVFARTKDFTLFVNLNTGGKFILEGNYAIRSIVDGKALLMSGNDYTTINIGVFQRI